jgi:hypothetical protein
LTNIEIAKHIACARTDHADFIELTFEESSKRAVDQVIGHLIDIISEREGEPMTRIYINSVELRKSQPILYLMGQLRASKSKLLTGDTARIAVTFNFLPLAQMINLFVNALRSPNIVFKAFSVQQADLVIPWLLSDL